MCETLKDSVAPCHCSYMNETHICAFKEQTNCNGWQRVWTALGGLLHVCSSVVRQEMDFDKCGGRTRLCGSFGPNHNKWSWPLHNALPKRSVPIMLCCFAVVLCRKLIKWHFVLMMVYGSGSQSGRYRPLGGGGITEVGANKYERWKGALLSSQGGR
jgi:hypothetical protein